MRKSASLAMVRGHGLDLWPHLLRQLALLVLVLLAVWIFRDRLIALDFANIRRSVGDLTPGQWVTACLATLTSFWAIGRYDDIVHGLSRTGVDPSRARASGMAAVGHPGPLAPGAGADINGRVSRDRRGGAVIRRRMVDRCIDQRPDRRRKSLYPQPRQHRGPAGWS